MDVKEEGLIKGDIGAHWYYRAKLSALLRMISDLRPSSVLDVGAGLGFFARSLLAETAITEATCIDPAYRVERCTMVGGKKLWFRPTIDSSDAELVLMMDVIEHVADDVGLVAEYVSKVREGTCFVVTVPAFMWLWSGHDVFLEHHRRYTLSGIEQTLCAAGLQVQCGCYFYGAVLPLVAASRLAARLLPGNEEPRSQMRQYGRVTNAIFWTMCRTELPIFQSNRIAGLTACVRAVKH